jgi:hypothetical protein
MKTQQNGPNLTSQPDPYRLGWVGFWVGLVFRAIMGWDGLRISQSKEIGLAWKQKTQN